MRRLLVALALLTPLAVLGAGRTPAAAAEPVDAAAATTAALFERDWAWRLEHEPEWATGIGEHGHDGLLSDPSPAGAQARTEHARRMLDAARRIDPERLEEQDRLSRALFIGDQERLLASAAIVPFDPQPISSQDGLQHRLPLLFAQMPYVTEDDYERYLARLRALPRHVDGLIDTLRTGMRTGWVAPRAVIAPVPEQLRRLREHLAESAVGAPLRRLPATVDAEARARIAREGAQALAQAADALLALESFLRSDYLPAARATIAASGLPGGAAWYALLVRQSTTTDLSAADIHALGLREMARIRQALQAAVPRTGFRGGLDAFMAFARSDPRLFPKDGAALLARYRTVAARAAQRLPQLFDPLPPGALELAVKPAQDGEAQGGAYYETGTPDRIAALVVNTARLDAAPLWEVETLALHEGVPGHHLQFARAQALSLPAFRRHAWYPAFGEGWALYAESLGPELGLTVEPFPAFGRLADEALRAARLVVDTGIHAQGWTREQAIGYLDKNTANPAPANAVEVDRIIARPGAALAYKIGQLRIKAWRRQAEDQLGERFDVRAFHEAVLGAGALPLDQLEGRLGRWLAAQSAAPK